MSIPADFQRDSSRLPPRTAAAAITAAPYGADAAASSQRLARYVAGASGRVIITPAGRRCGVRKCGVQAATLNSWMSPPRRSSRWSCLRSAAQAEEEATAKVWSDSEEDSVLPADPVAPSSATLHDSGSRQARPAPPSGMLCTATGRQTDDAIGAA